jgi:hypothetical protein
MAQWKHHYTEPPVDLRLYGSRPAEPSDTPAELINRTAWSLETNVDDLIKAYRDTPELLDANRLEIARAYGRLCWLVSALQATERKRAECTRSNLQAAE